jgi:hypothetical protein
LAVIGSIVHRAMAGSRDLVRPPWARTVPGLRHAECLAMMRLGSSPVSPARLQLGRIAMFAEWEDETALERFLTNVRLGRQLAGGWQVRLRLPELPRFPHWGRPVERLVANHPGAIFATAAIRPPRTFSTFSVWRAVRPLSEHGTWQTLRLLPS